MGARSFSVILTANLFGESTGILDSQVVTKLDFKANAIKLNQIATVKANT